MKSGQYNRAASYKRREQDVKLLQKAQPNKLCFFYLKIAWIFSLSYFVKI